MADKRTTTPAGPSTSLQRGKACLRCRKRKMRCDGVKPACQQCTKAKKGDACEYDDGKGKTRTQLMREQIARLEARVKELEKSSSSSSHGSPPANLSLSASASPTPFPLDMDSSPWDSQWNGIPDFPAVNGITDSYATEDPPIELAQMLLEIFLPHRHQVGLEVHVGRLRDSLHLPLGEQRHPVLMNSIYLWACYLSRPGSLCEHEPLYLSRALAAVNDAVPNPSKVIDFIQASCLLSMYFLSNGRLLEGSYHASAAASLAIQWGLHQLGSTDLTVGVIPCDRESTFRLNPAKDAIEQGERVLAFWQVFNLDRCWSVALRRPATIPDSKHPWTSVITPWPQRMEDYETGELEINSGSPTIQAFFVHQAQVSPVVGGFSTFAHRVKASALFEGASRLSSSWYPRLSSSPSFTENFRAFEHTITRFTTTLLPLHQLAATLPDEKTSLLLIHSLAHASMIHLHQPFLEDQGSRETAVRAARSLAVVAKHISDTDYDYLDPFIGHCWVLGSEILASEIAQLQAAWSPHPASSELRVELNTLLFSLTKVAAKFPLFGYQATKVQKLLDAI
ncbi:Zn(2)-C6 fungal-type domain-containing protein [Abortiporus biennis]